MAKPGSKREHDSIVRAVITILGREAYQLCRSFEHPTGTWYRDEEWGRQWQSCGIDGSGDIYGWLANGKLFFFEVKSGNAVQAENQKRFEAMCRKWNVHYAVVRHPQEALNYILKWSAQ